MKLNDFVDKVFVISLPEREDRFNSAKEQLDKYGIEFEKIKAIKHEDGKHGLRQTMTELFWYCQKNGYEKVCVFEDDINIVRPNFNELMDKCIEQLPNDFHLFYMGGNVWKQPIRKSDNILQTPAIYSTHAVIYTKEAMEFIYKKLESPSPFDVILVNSIQKFNKCYCSFPLLISQKSGYSDIEKKIIKYDKFIEKRYEEKTKGI